MTHIAAAPQRRNLALWSLVLLGVGLLGLAPLSLLKTSFGDSTLGGAVAFERTRIAYFEFDLHADTLWLADPLKPTNRIKGLTVAHAPEYGVIPSLSPDRRSLAFLVLPPDTPAPGPDAPAQLWIAPLLGRQPTLLVANADLLVRVVWSPDGRHLVFRRSGDAAGLYTVPAEGGAERPLVSSTDGIFPIGFTPDGSRLLYVSLEDQGSFLHQIEFANGVPAGGGKLSSSLTRDWALSPDGGRLAYLEMTFNGQEVAARAFILDLVTGRRVAAGVPGSDAFSPSWDSSGRLVIGQLAPGARSSAAAIISDGATTALAAPRRGFDVPLALDDQAGAAVTSFESNSIVNPGRASLVVVDAAGIRREIASGEVTFLGWITP